jgi:hypothetical protein
MYVINDISENNIKKIEKEISKLDKGIEKDKEIDDNDDNLLFGDFKIKK